MTNEHDCHLGPGDGCDCMTKCMECGAKLEEHPFTEMKGNDTGTAMYCSNEKCYHNEHPQG